MSSYELDDIGGPERPPSVVVRDAAPEAGPRGRRCAITWRNLCVFTLIASLMIALLAVLVYYNVYEKSSNPGSDTDSETETPDPQASTGDNDKAPSESTPNRQYEFVVEQIKDFNNPVPGNEKLIANLINGKVPAPAIHVKNGDWISIKLTNMIETSPKEAANLGLSIHWHGLDMRKAQIYDGVVGLTQCPIIEKESYNYNWQINEEPGTYWYHTHDRKMFPGGQTNFIEGPFIIHPSNSDLDLPSPDADPKGSYQIGNEIILFFSGDDLLINGEYQPTFDLNPGEYTFRIINGKHERPSSFLFSIQGSFGKPEKDFIVPLEVIATDAYQVSPPYNVDVINIAIAERYDVKVTFPDDAKTADIRIREDHPPETGKNQTVGCIVFDDSSKSECVRNESTWKTNKEVQILNCYSDMGGTCIPVTDLTSLHKRKLLDSFYFHTYDVGDNYVHDQRRGDFHFEVSIDRALFYNNSIPCEAAVKSSSRNHFDNETVILSLPTAKSVTIILRVQSNQPPDDAFAEQHPMHMHGHHFEVLEIVGGDKENNPDCKLLDLKTAFSEPIDKLMKREKQGVLKDTVILPACGAVAIRINSDNPGVWFFHCHIEWHLHHGLAVVIDEGNYMFSRNKSSLPGDYPICKPCGHT